VVAAVGKTSEFESMEETEGWRPEENELRRLPSGLSRIEKHQRIPREL
jgi:hypothetical protein